MASPENPERTPEREDRSPEQRGTSRRRTVVGVTGGAAVLLAGGALLVAQTRDTRPASLPEPPSGASSVAAAPAAGAPAPAPATASRPAASPAPAPASPAPASPATSPASTGEHATGGDAASGKHAAKSGEETRKEIDQARAKAKADGFALQRPPEAEGAAKMVDESAVKQWTEPIKNGTVRVTTARQDLTGASALLLAGDQGKPVGGGVSCTNKIRFTRDAPPTTQPTVLLCWRTSSTRSVVTMMAKPGGVPSADANVSIINREWAKLH